MALDPDPYRILELSRGASLDEVKRAYRRLAKANHPDAAGESALPRFLAIQAAYEQLIGPVDGAARGRRHESPRHARRGKRIPTGATRRDAPTAAERERLPVARRPAGRVPAARPHHPVGPPNWDGAASARPGRRRRPAPDGPAATPPPDSKRTKSPRSNKATLGSTSYDGADAEAFEPDWRGASWYGTTSGTYWTLNPKEYADPRKHGPEYQARARRSAKGEPRDGAPPTPPPGATGPTHTTSSWWDSTAGAAGAAGWASASEGGPSAPPPSSARQADPPRHDPPPADPPFDLGRSAAEFGRLLVDERAGGMPGRIVRAIVGWIPIAIAIGWFVGELTGCGRFAATCDGSSEPLVLGLQILTLAILLVVPSLAALATIATLTVLVAAVFGALTLSSTGEAADLEARAATLGVVLLVAWTVGLVVAIARRVRAAPSPTRPVS